MGLEIRHEEGRGRFVAALPAGEAYLRYRRAGEGTLDYVSTFVPPAERGRGIGRRLVRHALAYARREGYEVIPTCPFVRRVMGEERPG